MRNALFFGIVLVCAVVVMGDEEQAKRPTSPSALKALSAYETAVKSATDEYIRKMQVAGDVAVRALEDAKKAAVHHEDLDEANAITTAVQRIKDASPTPPAMLDVPTGVWHVDFMNGATRNYRISPDGSVTWEESGSAGNSRPRLRRTSAGLTVQFHRDEIDRITFIGGRLYEEVFKPASDFPGKKPWTMGLGTR